MATGSENLSGPRLEFVVRALPGTVSRFKHKAPPTKDQVKADPKLAGELTNEKIPVVEEAGYMVYLPTGFCYRMSPKDLVRRGFDRQPNILSFEQANNTSTPAGRFKLARTEQERNRAMREMEEQIINHCQGRVGKVDSMIEGYDPKGKIEEAA